MVHFCKIHNHSLESVNLPSDNVHSIRLCEKLLEEMPYLTDAKQEKERVLMYMEDIGDSVKKALSEDSDTEAKYLH